MKRKNILKSLFENWPVKVLSILAAILLFVFNRWNTEKIFNIPLEIQRPAGYAIANEYPKSVQIILRGLGDLGDLREGDLRVSADLTEHKEEGTVSKVVQIQKRGAALNIGDLDIEINPNIIEFELEKEFIKSVPIEPLIKGTPAHGYTLESPTISPSRVTIAGPRSYIQKIDTIFTEEIDITDRKSNISMRMNLLIDSPLEAKSASEVEFHLVISEAVSEKEYDNIDIIYIDLSPELIVASKLPTGKIKLQARQLLLEEIVQSQVRLIVDCSNITDPGEYELTPKPDVPAGAIVLKYEPQTLTIVFVEAVEPEGEI